MEFSFHNLWRNQFKCFDNLVTNRFNYCKLSFKFRLSFKVFRKTISLIVDFSFQASWRNLDKCFDNLVATKFNFYLKHWIIIF
jgi:hypothetical protein